MKFRRKIYSEMMMWKTLSGGTTAFLIEGARRVGKSTIAVEFAKHEYSDYLVLDFAKEPPEVKDLFEKYMTDLNEFFRNLFLFKGKSLPAGRSVIIFDEVQMYPKARQSIKYLVEDGRYDYIETGSLISIRRNVMDIVIPSEEEKHKMYPMDFEEFLWATGDNVTADAIRENFQNRKGFDDAVHRKIMQKFRTYIAVGGMPQAVAAFADNKTYAQIDYVKRGILDLYTEDLKKYDTDENEKASIIFRTIPEQLENHNSHFRFSLVDKNARYRDYVDAVSFVQESMMGNECINVTKPDVTLEAFADRSNFKLYMGDTGLLITEMMADSDETDDNLYKALILNNLSIDQGMIMENAVAQMLRAGGHNLYFHEYLYTPEGSDREKKYEIDFLLVRKRKIVPVEVKSSDYKAHKSFDYFVRKYQLKMEERYIIHSRNYRYEDGITYLPFYMTMCL
ncbi:MAG: ATP-binding protein [Bullifex sp.]